MGNAVVNAPVKMKAIRHVVTEYTSLKNTGIVRGLKKRRGRKMSKSNEKSAEERTIELVKSIGGNAGKSTWRSFEAIVEKCAVQDREIVFYYEAFLKAFHSGIEEYYLEYVNKKSGEMV